MSAAFLFSQSITHGLNLANNSVLEYLYYLEQIPISMAPLGEDSIYCRYSNNPFKRFFDCGLKVSLSSDNPLQIHMTDEPLIEEYATAGKVLNRISIFLFKKTYPILL